MREIVEPPIYTPTALASRPTILNFNPLLLVMDMVGLPVLLGIGALMQLLASRVGYWYVPGFILILLPALRNLLSYLGIIQNRYMKHVIMGRTCGALPRSYATGDANEEMAVLQLGTRTNSGLGLLDPVGRVIAKHFQEMMNHLETNAHDAGYLGSEKYIGLERPSQNTLLITFYFRSYEDIHRFAHGFHMQGWKAYAALDKVKARGVSIWHEAYVVSQSESIYVNTAPIGMGNLWGKDESVKDEAGTEKWINGLHSISHKSNSKDRLRGVI